MLFKIINLYPDLYSKEKDKLLAISNILKSHGERKNIVIAERDALITIIKSDSYGELEKIYSEDILSNIREVSNLTSTLQIHVVIDFENTTRTSIYDEKSKAILAGYKLFTDTEKINHPSFLAENESDYEFYKIISTVYLKHELKANIGINFSFCLGAGSHCKAEFNRLKSENKIVFCIVDNDKAHPNKKEGDTSSAFTNEDRCINGLSFVEVLLHREIESLIPLKIMEEIVVEKIQDKISTMDEIKSSCATNNMFMKHFDFKEGIDLQEMISLDNTHGNFWTEIIAHNPRFNTKDCLRYKSPKHCAECSCCPKINGISEHLLSHALEKIERTNTKSIYQNLDPIIRSEWSRLGHLISSWGCHLKYGASRT